VRNSSRGENGVLLFQTVPKYVTRESGQKWDPVSVLRLTRGYSVTGWH